MILYQITFFYIITQSIIDTLISVYYNENTNHINIT